MALERTARSTLHRRIWLDVALLLYRQWSSQGPRLSPRCLHWFLVRGEEIDFQTPRRMLS